MENEATAIFSAIWLGILTSISPCPLATNIAAVSYIGKQIKGTYGSLTAGLSYTIGRSIAYVIVSAIIIFGLRSIPQLSNFLQQYMIKILGPLLIIAGLFVLEILSINIKGASINQKFQKHLADGGILGACFLGFIFALSFCPVSAALFFGSLIPLSLSFESKFFMPFLYGVGTALPVMFFAIIISYASRFAAVFFNKLSYVELWLRRATGALFIIIGIYFSVRYIFLEY